MLNYIRRISRLFSGDRIHGNLESCEFDSISGWARSPKPGDAGTEVGVFVNNELRYQLPANEYREDVRTRESGCTGNCGFKLDLPAGQFLNMNDRVDVRILPGNYPLLNSPLTVSTYRRRHNNHFFFLHLPKTAGTAFRSSIVENFLPEAIYPTAADIDANGGDYPYLFHETEKGKFADIELFMGHYPLAIRHLLAEDVRTIIFLRDPIKRAISNLLHIKNLWPTLSDKSLEDILTIPQIRSSQLCNVQAKFLSDTVWTSRLRYLHTIGPEGVSLDNALENLENLSFVGLTEEYDVSLQMLEKKYGFRLVPSRMNVTDSHEKSAISKEILEMITQCNQQDIVLYKRAQELFRKQEQLLLPKP